MDKHFMKTDPPETRADQRLDDFYAVRAARAVDVGGFSGRVIVRLGADSLVMLRAAVAGIDDERNARKTPRCVEHVDQHGVGLIPPAAAAAGEIGMPKPFPSPCVLFHSSSGNKKARRRMCDPVPGFKSAYVYQRAVRPPLKL